MRNELHAESAAFLQRYESASRPFHSAEAHGIGSYWDHDGTHIQLVAA
jgi:hypothetical protein